MSSTDLLAPGGVTHVPGVYDPASAALAVRAGIRAAYLSGEAIAATMLEPSTVSATQIADRAAVLGSFLGGVPLLADANVGFEDPDAAVWAALSYQRAGISGIVLNEGSPLRVAAVKERAPGVLVIATAPGDTLGEIIARCRALASAGADAVLPLGARETDLRSLHAALPDVRLVLNRTEGASGGGRHLSDAELAAAGVILVLHPLTAVLAALRAASVAYHALTVPPTATGSEALTAGAPGPAAPGTAAADPAAAGPATPGLAVPGSAVPGSAASGPAAAGAAGPAQATSPAAFAPDLSALTIPAARSAPGSPVEAVEAVDQIDLMPPAVLATLAPGRPASFLPEPVTPLPAPRPAVAPTPFGAPAFGSRDDRPWAAAVEPAERPWDAVSQPDELPASDFDQPRSGDQPRPGVAPAQRPGATASGRTWTSIAREVSRLGT
ncbi:isocitrate lyase/phosphoenolpyruvate mutase family protein [Paractinoplanes atraurantiacus]|nr:isocitrate lyase/phosphoenolpyruvate mutase family protein [Actinoplanes atraurantiacus]